MSPRPIWKDSHIHSKHINVGAPLKQRQEAASPADGAGGRPMSQRQERQVQGEVRALAAADSLRARKIGGGISFVMSVLPHIFK
jgi:hypothetical protein